MKNEKTVQAEKAFAAGKRYAVVAAYSHNNYAGGDIVSCHNTYELARGAARRSGYDTFRAIRELAEYLD
jgi:hypothetical protein